MLDVKVCRCRYRRTITEVYPSPDLLRRPGHYQIANYRAAPWLFLFDNTIDQLYNTTAPAAQGSCRRHSHTPTLARSKITA